MSKPKPIFQGIQRGGGTYAGLEHPGGASGPGSRALAQLPRRQQVLALLHGSHLHRAYGHLTHWQRHRHLDF